ncbi:MAG: hypothetical protein LH469_01220 [Frankiaceae bacterium]|nr:hypothetical protein [Frankiaceae bacterium]
MPQTALAELYARQAPKAGHLAYLLTGDRLLAEDLVQDCFVKLAGRLRPVDDPGAYLRRMVVKAAQPPPQAEGAPGQGPGRAAASGAVRQHQHQHQHLAEPGTDDRAHRRADRRPQRAAQPRRPDRPLARSHRSAARDGGAGDGLGGPAPRRPRLHRRRLVELVARVRLRCRHGARRGRPGARQGGDRATPDCGAEVVTRQYDGLFLLLDGDRLVGWVTGTPGLTTGGRHRRRRDAGRPAGRLPRPHGHRGQRHQRVDGVADRREAGAHRPPGRRSAGRPEPVG